MLQGPCQPWSAATPEQGGKVESPGTLLSPGLDFGYEVILRTGAASRTEEPAGFAYRPSGGKFLCCSRSLVIKGMTSPRHRPLAQVK